MACSIHTVFTFNLNLSNNEKDVVILEFLSSNSDEIFSCLRSIYPQVTLKERQFLKNNNFWKEKLAFNHEHRLKEYCCKSDSINVVLFHWKLS